MSVARAVTQLTALAELSVIAPKGRTLHLQAAAPLALPKDINVLQRLRILRLSCHQRLVPPLLLPQLSCLCLEQPLVEPGDGWPWLAMLPVLAELSIVEAYSGAADAGVVRLVGVSGCRNLTSLRVNGTDAAAMLLENGPYWQMLRRLDVTMTGLAWSQTGQLSILRAATQLSELRLSAWPNAADVEVRNLHCMPRLRSLNVELGQHASPAYVANTTGEVQRRLPSVEVRFLEPHSVWWSELANDQPPDI